MARAEAAARLLLIGEMGMTPSESTPTDAVAGAPPLADVFSADELARAAGVPPRQVRTLIRQAAIPSIDGVLVAGADALRACQALRRGQLSVRPVEPGIGLLSRHRARSTPAGQTTPLSLLVSGSVHGLVLAVVLVMATTAVPSARPEASPETAPDLVQLVFVAEPGPGGGGGGGGRRDPSPPPPAERVGSHTVSSPLPRREPPRLAPPRAKPKPRPPLEREPLPELLAPLAAVGADTRDVSGLLSRVVDPPVALPAPVDDSRGAGTGGGVGSGAGLGVGEGTGRGVGPGDGGGTGGGPYRPGSGIEPPGLLREVAPDYTQQARRAGLEGEVLLEMVVTADGTVTDVRVIRRLGAGLDERAVAAVRQWQFSPALRHGTRVAVLVEVAVEFRLR